MMPCAMSLNLMSADGTGQQDSRLSEPTAHRGVVQEDLPHISRERIELVVGGADPTAVLAFSIGCIGERVLLTDDLLLHLGTCVFEEQ